MAMQNSAKGKQDKKVIFAIFLTAFGLLLYIALKLTLPMK